VRASTEYGPPDFTAKGNVGPSLPKGLLDAVSFRLYEGIPPLCSGSAGLFFPLSFADSG